MRILIDECVPGQVRHLLSAHACMTVQKRGWAGIKNGELLKLAEAEFDLFLTSDQSITYQQNLAGRRISILQLSTNKLRQIQAAATQIQWVVDSMVPGEFRLISIP